MTLVNEWLLHIVKAIYALCKNKSSGLLGHVSLFYFISRLVRLGINYFQRTFMMIEYRLNLVINLSTEHENL